MTTDSPSGRRIISLAPLLALLASIASATAGADPAGTQLAQRVYDRPDGTDITVASTMTLTEQGRSPRVRRLIVYSLEKGTGALATLIRFLEPGDIAGTGLLTLDPAVGDSDQWLYLPAMQRVRRIASDRKGGRFVGSDYYFEDLRDRKVSQDEHRVTGRETVGGVRCEVLESAPVEASNSVYRKRVSCIDPVRLLPMRIDLFEKSTEAPNKRWTMIRAENVQGYWTVMDSTMTDLETGHETRLVVEKVVYDRGLPEDLFSTKALEDEVREARHRP
jgi:hypothetical protein